MSGKVYMFSMDWEVHCTRDVSPPWLSDGYSVIPINILKIFFVEISESYI